MPHYSHHHPVSSPEHVVLKVGARVGRKNISPIVVPIIPPLANNPAYRERHLPMEDASRWRANSAGHKRIQFDPEEQAVRFDTTFPKEVPAGSAHWIYPEFPLTLPEENMTRAVGISFELKVKEFDAPCFGANLMAVMEYTREKGRDAYYSCNPRAGCKDWQTVVIALQGAAPPEFDPGRSTGYGLA